MRKIRLFIGEKKLHPILQVKVVDGDFDYLTKVMRQKIGDELFVFNGSCGEFSAKIVAVEKRFLNIEIKEKVAELKTVPNFTLAFAPTKNVAIDFVAKKELSLELLDFSQLLLRVQLSTKLMRGAFLLALKRAWSSAKGMICRKFVKLKK